jgi:hypothetical protein
LSERPKLFHCRASGIAGCSDYGNRDRRLLPTGSRLGYAVAVSSPILLGLAPHRRLGREQFC